MKQFGLLLFILPISLTVVLTGCDPTKVLGVSGSEHGLNRIEEQNANYLSIDPAPENTDPLRSQLGSFFLVEHFSVQHNNSMDQAIRAHQPGGIVFWNPDHADALKIREVVRAYSNVSKNAGGPPILFSADYEGGELGFTPNGHMIAGVQRFRDGFTLLAHPIWFDKSLATDDDEICRLHAKILTKELKSVGINFPLSVTSDLATRLFIARGVSKNPRYVAKCLKAMLDTVAAEKNLIFVTKHFPGLGQAVGDTHDSVAISQVKTLEQADLHLFPFRKLIADVNTKNTWPSLSLMASHALFPLFDPDHITTESPLILQGLLRDELHFKGILVSDAMWMGSYGKLPADKLMPTYLKAFLAGMDMLMIPGSKFSQAITYFRAVFDKTLTDEQKLSASELIGQDWETIHSLFLIRAKASLATINKVRGTLAPSVDIMDEADVSPSALTKTERARYYQLLIALDPRWVDHLPVTEPPK